MTSARDKIRQDDGNVFADVESHLRYLKLHGIDEVPASQGAMSFLSGKPALSTKGAMKKQDMKSTQTAQSASISSWTPPEEPMTLEALREAIGDCQRCKLAKERNELVFGVGNPNAELVFVGEAPGAEEDKRGEPFVGRAGQLLDKMITAMGKTRQDIYICNVLKCRPPGNRDPEADEVLECEPFLIKQIESISPKVICALGAHAAKTLLKTQSPIGKLRGRFHYYHEVKLLPTYHPAYLLRNPSMKKPAWEDLQMVMRELNWPVPG